MNAYSLVSSSSSSCSFVHFNLKYGYFYNDLSIEWVFGIA